MYLVNTKSVLGLRLCVLDWQSAHTSSLQIISLVIIVHALLQTGK